MLTDLCCFRSILGSFFIRDPIEAVSKVKNINTEKVKLEINTCVTLFLRISVLKKLLGKSPISVLIPVCRQAGVKTVSSLCCIHSFFIKSKYYTELNFAAANQFK